MKNKIRRIIAATLYVLFVLWITVFSREPGTIRVFQGLFWEIEMGYWNNILQNIALFIPLGVIVGGKRGIVAGVILSMGIEAIQYTAALGYCELDDVMNNTIGAAIGSLFVSKYGERIEQLCTKLIE